MGLYRAGGSGGSANVQTVTLSQSLSVTNPQTWYWDLTGISGYKNLVLWESLFPEPPEWVTAVNTNQSSLFHKVAKLSYTYNSSTGRLTATLNSGNGYNNNTTTYTPVFVYGGTWTVTMTVKVHYIA